MLFQSRSWLMAVTLLTASCAASGVNEGSSAARDPNVPGATGQTVVVGSHSSMAGSDRVHPDWNNAVVGAERGD
jgi:hypothetical protein